MRIVVAVLLLLSLSSCSSKFAYNNLDWWVYWYLDDYIELNDRQEEQFDDYLNNWLSWHKRSELNRYKAHLERVKKRLPKISSITKPYYSTFNRRSLIGSACVMKSAPNSPLWQKN